MKRKSNLNKFFATIKEFFGKARRYLTATRILAITAVGLMATVFILLAITAPSLQARMESTKGVTYVTNDEFLDAQMQAGYPYLTYWYKPENTIVANIPLDVAISYIPGDNPVNFGSDIAEFQYSCTTSQGFTFPGKDAPGLASSKSEAIKEIRQYCVLDKPWQLEYGYRH